MQKVRAELTVDGEKHIVEFDSNPNVDDINAAIDYIRAQRKPKPQPAPVAPVAAPVAAPKPSAVPVAPVANSVIGQLQAMQQHADVRPNVAPAPPQTKPLGKADIIGMLRNMPPAPKTMSPRVLLSADTRVSEQEAKAQAKKPKSVTPKDMRDTVNQMTDNIAKNIHNVIAPVVDNPIYNMIAAPFGGNITKGVGEGMAAGLATFPLNMMAEAATATGNEPADVRLKAAANIGLNILPVDAVFGTVLKGGLKAAVRIAARDGVTPIISRGIDESLKRGVNPHTIIEALGGTQEVRDAVISKLPPSKSAKRLEQMMSESAPTVGDAPVSTLGEKAYSPPVYQKPEAQPVHQPTVAPTVTPPVHEPPKAAIPTDTPAATGLANQVLAREGLVGEKGKVNAFGASQAEGKILVDEGKYDPEELAKQIASEERPFNRDEAGVLLEGKRRLDNIVNSAKDALDKADPSTHGDALQAYEDAKARRQSFIDNVQKGKTEWHNTGKALQEGTTLDYGNFAEVLGESNRMAPSATPPKVEKKIATQTTKYKELDAAETQLIAQQDQNVESAMQTAARDKKFKSIEQLDAEKAKIIEQSKRRMSKGARRGRQGGSAQLPFDPIAVGQMAWNYVERGATKLEDVVHGVQSHFDVTERQVRDAMAGHLDAKKLTDAEVEAKRLKAEAKAIKDDWKARATTANKIEDMITELSNGVNFKKNAAESKKMSDELKNLKAQKEELGKQINELKSQERQKVEGLQQIESMKGALKTGVMPDQKVRTPKQVSDELARIRAEKDSLRRQIQATIEARKPKSWVNKVESFGRESQLANPINRLVDLGANTTKLGAHLAQNPLRAAINSAMFPNTAGRETLALSGIKRVMSGSRERWAREVSDVWKGADADSLGKFGGGGIASKSAGVTDVAFKDIYTRMALNDFAKTFAKGDKALNEAAWRQLTEGASGPMLPHQVDTAHAVAHDWALRQTFNAPNLASSVVGGLKAAPVKLFKDHGYGEGAVDGWKALIDSTFRFSKVIGNVALERANYNPVLGVGEAGVRAVAAKARAIKATGWGAAIPATEARLIADLAVKGLTGLATFKAGQAALPWIQQQDWIKGEIASTAGGTKFIRWTLMPNVAGGIDATQLGGLTTPMLSGATKAMIDQSNMTQKAKDTLWNNYQLESTISQPLFGGAADITDIVNGKKDVAKYAGGMIARQTPLMPILKEVAERKDFMDNQVRMRKSDSFWDEFIKRLPVLRESLPSNEKKPYQPQGN